MYLGRIAETGPVEDIYNFPTHPYTQALLSAAPVADPARRDQSHVIRLEGDVPSPANPPSGCRFRTRCWKADERCAREEPQLAASRGAAAPEQLAACHYAAVAPTTG
jgi:oligopeptide/dipeptide ABC transporter ATP-binding protein